MNQVLRMLFAFLTLSLASSAFAYGDGNIWSGGGGKLRPDDGNPWWVHNTKHVYYCVEIADDFGVSRERALELINLAIKYWKEEFEAAYFGGDWLSEDKIATQTFHLTECSTNNQDLTFQLGVLHQDQIQKLKEEGKEPKDFVGLTIRTSYDEVTLRGKGFIYITPEGKSNPLRIPGVQMKDTFWSESENGALHKMLVHEMGHVFGVPHIVDTMDWHPVMGAQFPEALINRDGLVRGGDLLHYIDGLFTNRRGTEDGSPALLLYHEFGYYPDIDKTIRKFFGSSEDAFSITFYKANRATLNVYDKDETPIGVIRLEEKIQTEGEPIVQIVLNANQKVYDLRDPAEQFIPVRGPSLLIEHGAGVYENLRTGEKHPIFVKIHPDPRRTVIGGFLDGKAYADLFQYPTNDSN
ncbi:MAG: hypothetical protein AB7T49_14850 [Oligoflexales bacterium]